jgi:hypothetical protein
LPLSHPGIIFGQIAVGNYAISRHLIDAGEPIFLRCVGPLTRRQDVGGHIFHA